MKDAALIILSASNPGLTAPQPQKEWFSAEDTITLLAPVGPGLSGIGIDLLKIFFNHKHEAILQRG